MTDLARVTRMLDEGREEAKRSRKYESGQSVYLSKYHYVVTGEELLAFEQVVLAQRNEEILFLTSLLDIIGVRTDLGLSNERVKENAEAVKEACIYSQKARVENAELKRIIAEKEQFISNAFSVHGNLDLDIEAMLNASKEK